MSAANKTLAPTSRHSRVRTDRNEPEIAPRESTVVRAEHRRVELEQHGRLSVVSSHTRAMDSETRLSPLLRHRRAAVHRQPFSADTAPKDASEKLRPSARIRAAAASLGPRRVLSLLGAAALLAALVAPRVNDAFIADPQPSASALPYDAVTEQDPLGVSSSLLQRRDDPEARLVKVLMQISDGDINGALKDVDQLLTEQPNFRLAHLVKGDLLLARTRALPAFGAGLRASPDSIRDLEAEARARLHRYQQTLSDTDQLPRYLVRLGPQQSHAIVVDAKRSRLLVYGKGPGGGLHLVDDFYITIGKNGPDKLREGDQRTPVGVYEVTASLPREKLTDFYGSGAFPINYPNAWDQRGKRGGSGIWLHGVPSDTYSRPPRASNGCVVLSNRDLEAIRPYIKPGMTPVVIAENVEWSNGGALEELRAEVEAEIEAWRSDWETRDFDRFARHYHRTFNADGKSADEWLAQKRGTNAAKTWITVKLDDVSIFGYPGNDKLAVVTFEQDYRSNNYNSASRKRQYWLHTDSDWQIVYEGLDS